MRAERIIIRSMRRGRKERGLRISEPNGQLSEGHIRKADHNLIVMTDLSRLGHEDWVVISAYYAMYQSAMALITKMGMESKDHATTVAVLEYFFGGRISKEAIGKFNELKERKDRIEAMRIGERYIDYMWKIKRARETVQYGISVSYKETGIVMRNAREFVSKMKLVLDELDEKVIGIIGERIKALRETAIR